MSLMAEDIILSQELGKSDEDGFSTARISRHRFTSRDMLSDEFEKMFSKVWLLVCPIADVAKPGDAFPIMIGKEPVVVVHGDDGQIRAFYNVCQHRGRQIVTERRNIRSLYCWFHGFEWNLDGSLRNIPDKESFQGYTDEKDVALPPIRCAVWQKLVWINLDPGAESLEDFLGEAGRQLAQYGLDTYNFVGEQIIEWDCNWKIAADAFQEGYHGPVTHPQLQFYLEDAEDMPIDLYGLHSRGLYQMGAPCSRLPEEQRRTAQPGLKAMAAAAGVDADEYEGRLDEMRLAMQRGMRAKLTEHGYDVASLADDQMTDDFHYFIFPNITINTFAERFSIFRYMPHPDDPARSTFWVQQFERPAEQGTKVPRPQTIHGRGLEYKFENEVYNQDARNVPWLQKGVNSKGFKGMLFNRQERRLRHFYDSLDRYLSAEEDA
ncbi:hypothetical protein CVO77_14795 [Sphingopyxis lindanitolerans]|uniref:Rieske domain-containing protein n=2 Tax=Sphingopyxis lindanitolerans TaxID=2054227 RepID=A0A2S8B1P3_9SPHN|nr:hypothetical protein CVO77_14795 [Sphingopyxis lindanitolerans]